MLEGHGGSTAINKRRYEVAMSHKPFVEREKLFSSYHYQSSVPVFMRAHDSYYDFSTS